MSRKTGTSFVGHPSAKFIRPFSGGRVFQQPRDFATTTASRFWNDDDQWFNRTCGGVHLPETIEVRINEAYRDYTPPVNVLKTLHRLLRTVPGKYLRGLDCIVLTNEAGMSRKDRVGRVWSRRRKFDKSRVLGRYHGSSRDCPYIELRVDKIISSLNGTFLRIPLLREIGFGSVLFHELGHHIHHKICPQHEEKEDVADQWAKKLIGNFIRKQYWYALPILIPAAKIYRVLRRKQWL